MSYIFVDSRDKVLDTIGIGTVMNFLEDGGPKVKRFVGYGEDAEGALQELEAKKNPTPADKRLMRVIRRGKPPIRLVE